ncbi:uncharacterized protein EV420DRAFT_1505792 [Desarmillaria tabescens]|uniref:RING-type domain-containing protein n=1 Tax=Armillaria tabescens TaxID=1929756 RepID=A0AA39TUI3_ARMTA|nr:uncharacterized protein EV420DRAFT_1505792 [Desarmillaria tabescens]KAK0466858.1 hypothetical protein EV420DRAFT_1505792 [Desarmillaria tabescens]
MRHMSLRLYRTRLDTCGHIYCLKCVSDYILSSSLDGFTASCPTCRTKFCIGENLSLSESLKSLPKQFHRYITPSIRRVFVEPEAFKQRLDALEARNATLERDNRVLMAAVAKKNHLQKMKRLEAERKSTCVHDDARYVCIIIGLSNLFTLFVLDPR